MINGGSKWEEIINKAKSGKKMCGSGSGRAMCGTAKHCRPRVGSVRGSKLVRGSRALHSMSMVPSHSVRTISISISV